MVWNLFPGVDYCIRPLKKEGNLGFLPVLTGLKLVKVQSLSAIER